MKADAKTVDPVGAVPTLGAKLFRGFADPTRLAILLALLEGELRVVDLVREIGTSQPNVSGHLACLKDCGLVTDRPEGRQMFYRIAHPDVYELLRAADAVLAANGVAIELCPSYEAGRGQRRRTAHVRRRDPGRGRRRRT